MGLYIIDNWDELGLEGNRNYYINKFEEYTARTISNDNPKQHILKCIDELAAICMDEPCEYLDSYMWWQARPYKNDWYAKVQWMPFENLKVPVPCGYDKILTVMYDEVIRKIHPDYVIHGENWLEGPMKAIRDNVKELLKNYGGEIIDVPYTYNEEVRKVEQRMKAKLAMPEYRRKRLRQLIEIRHLVKALEVHSGLTGLIAEKTIVEHNGELDQFDAMWISSLCDSTAKGKPDIELVDMTSRFRTIDDVTEVTTKPIIFDGDTGGLTEHFVYTVRSPEKMGVSAIIIEDKTGLKKDSLRCGTKGINFIPGIDTCIVKRRQLSWNGRCDNVCSINC